jgi:peptidoglycan/xylan/chitin deacetylase (PgdA/CDA1 family)
MSIVLAYHAVADAFPAPLAVTPAALEDQLALLVKRRYRGVTFSELAAAEGKGKLLAVTFDDAYRSVHARAAPIMASLGIPGTVFAPTSYIGTERPMSWPGIDRWLETSNASELVPMSWDELRSLAESGWEVGSHTVTHPRLTSLDDDRLYEELRVSAEECTERIGRRCTSIAYPFGDHDDRVVEAAGRAGYAWGATLPARLPRATALRWPRIGVYDSDDLRRFRLKVSPLVRLARSTPVWSLVRPGPEPASSS